MQLAYAVGKDFTGKEDLVGAKYSKLLKLEIFPDGHGKVIFLAADMCGSPRPRAGGMLLGSFKPHALLPLNHLPPFTRWRKV